MKTKTLKQQQEELEMIEVSKRFIDDIDYSEKEKDTFIKGIRKFQKQEDKLLFEKFVRKLGNYNYLFHCKECYKLFLEEIDKLSQEVLG
jgi:hypothetical protein